MRVEKGEGWELRLGRWQDVLGDVSGDVLITDPPYSEKTTSGHNAARTHEKRQSLSYEYWTERDVMKLVCHLPVNGWRVVLTDHVLGKAWSDYFKAADLYPFAPLPYVAPGSRVRFAGDGPSCWTTWIIVARPRTKPWSCWGTLRGAYTLPKGASERGMFIGGKPQWLMRALVSDYSKPDDLIIDPCAGSGSTLLAAVTEGRRAIGAEMNPEAFDFAVERLRGAQNRGEERRGHHANNKR